MLVISRKQSEILTLDISPEDIAKLAVAGRGITGEVIIVDIGNDRVRLGVTLPLEVQITRPDGKKPKGATA